jgi:ATP-dependent helicase/nuclease subunit A
MEMKFNPEQETAIFSEKPLVVISAGAGSGKTRVLTERYVHLCEQKLQERLGNSCSPIGAAVEEIVAITFTEKAAREMKDRIRGRIEAKRLTVEKAYPVAEQQKAREFWQEQKEALDGALITTFHSFCHKLLHEYAFEADVTPNFTVLDDVQSKLIQIDIFEEMYESPDYHQVWRPLYNYYTRNQLKDAIKAVYSQMKEIITSVSSIESFFDCEQIIAIQLSTIETARKAVLEQFYENAKPFVMEFDEEEKVHKSIVNHFAAIGNSSFENPEVLYSELVEAMPKRIVSSWKEKNPPLYELYEQFFKPLKETWKNFKGPTEEEIEEIKEIIKLFAHMLAVFHEKYDARKRERAALDFSDLQQRAIALLENEAVQVACRQKYKHMMIDEFQDTNQLQMNMLRFIQPAFQFVVGDGKQSIYRFRGADVSLMKELVEHSKQDSNSDFINMSTNYRTCDSIIEFVNQAFGEIMGGEETVSDLSYKINYTTINSHRNGEEERKRRVELITVPVEEETEDSEEEQEGLFTEYEVITNRMLGLLEEKPLIVADKDTWRAPEWRDFAILIQARTKLAKLEKALKDKGVPYVVYGGIGFYEKQEVRDMLTLLEWINRPWEPLYILSLLRSPLFGVSVEGFLTIDECLEEERSLASYIYEGIFANDQSISEELKRSLTKLKHFYESWVPYTPQVAMKDYLEELLLESGLKAMLLLQRNNIQLIRNVEKLIAVLAEFQTSSLDELLKQVKQLAALSEKEGEAEVELAEGNMVHIMTVHASKGLEFPIVFLPDLAKGPKGDSGTIRFDKDVRLAVQYKKEIDPLKTPAEKSSPSFKAIKARSKDQAIEEAKRLFYVAVTRAKDYLVLSTLEKTTSHSWYDMLLKAIEKNGHIQTYIQEIAHVPESEKWEDTGVPYEPAMLIERDLTSESFSVSEIMAFINDPLNYYYKYIVKIEDHWLEEKSNEVEIGRSDEQLSGATLGTAVHRVCELLDYGYDYDDAKEEALAMVEDELEKGRYEKALEELINNYRVLEKLNIGTTVANEWPFNVEIEGIQVIGEIDKIVKKDGLYHLIDLKTNKSQNYEQLISYYTPQLYLYKMAFEKEYKQKVSQLSLFFMRGGADGFRTIDYHQEAEAQLKKVIINMTSLKQAKAGKKEYETLLHKM